MKDFNIVFMGTPEFAIPSLQILLENNYRITGVVTAPDKPRGRGKQVTGSAIKEFSLKKGLKVLQPEKLKDEAFLSDLKSLNADLQVVVAFRMLPAMVWSMPPYGTVNLHASLLPDYRGAAPINWSIINGEKNTGVTTFYIDREIDTGKIILQEEEPIYDDDDAGSLHDRLMYKGAELVLKTVELIRSGKVTTKVQTADTALKKAPKITGEMCGIDFSKPASDIRKFILGLSPYPGARTIINGRIIKIFRAEAEEGHMKGAPGEFQTDGKSWLKFKTGKGILNIREFQVEGKKRMTTGEFLRGNKL